jgi:hypothetical protein
MARREVLVRRALSVLLGLAATTMSAAEVQRGAPGDTVTPILGQWVVGTENGAPILTADARKWDGKPPTTLDAIARRLFGVVTPEFTANATSAVAFPIAVFDRIKTFDTGTLAVEFKLIGGESDQIAGLVFDLRPSGEYFYVRYNTRDDNVALWRFRNGERAVVAHGANHRRLAMNTWHPLTLTLKGRAVRAVAAGDLAVEFELDQPASGRVGVWTKRDSVTAFRNWRVTQ